mgnify:CR=1 FL=1
MKKKQTISVCSFKGGTAKTSAALHIGASLAKHHKKKVLLIDFDAQANLTSGLGFDPDEHDSLAEVLKQRKNIKDVIKKTSVKNLSLIPADTWLERVEVTEPLACDRYSHEILKGVLAEADYDFILIDTPPSLCWLTESALIASDHTVICATPEFYSVKGLERLSQFIKSLSERHPLNILGVLLSFWNARGKNNETFLDVIESTFPSKLLKPKIRRDVLVSEAAILGKPLFEIEKESRAADDFKEATKALLQNLIRKDS